MQSERNHLLLSRRKFLTNTSIALAAFASRSVVGASRFASAGSATTEIVEVETAYGRLGGRRNGGLITFKGIPYAGPVSGENRFKAPPPFVPWTGSKGLFQQSVH
jgi:para-nitrobenzyl esterase